MNENFGAKQDTLKSAPEKETQHLIVEIGSGMFPLPSATSQEHRKWMHENKNVHYIGIDTDESYLAIGKAMTASTDQRPAGHGLGGTGIGTTERIEFEHGDATKLRFGDESVSEVILRNVTGYKVIPIDARLKMIAEAARVLKPGGILTLIEQYTPSVARDQKIMASIARLAQTSFEYVGKDQRVPLERTMDERMLSFGSDWEERREEKDLMFILRLQKRGAPADFS